jgi:hypothetical protein
MAFEAQGELALQTQDVGSLRTWGAAVLRPYMTKPGQVIEPRLGLVAGGEGHGGVQAEQGAAAAAWRLGGLHGAALRSGFRRTGLRLKR